MRLGYLTYGLDRNPTGIGRYTVELLRGLAATRNEIEIVLLTTERVDKYGLWDQFEHHALPGCRLLPALLTVGNIAIRNAVSRFHLDLIHDPNGIAPFLLLDTGMRRIVTVYDAFAYVCPETHNRLDNIRYQYQLPSTAQRAHAVTTVSECSRRDLVKYLGLDAERVWVVPAGVDHQFQPIVDNENTQNVLQRYAITKPYILYVGGISARKNIAGLFTAYEKVRRQYPVGKLVVAGKRQWQTGEVDATFQRLNLENRVHYTGYVDDTDLPVLYSSASLFVFPSLYEGFGLPPLEAMACGTPVVTANVSSLPEVVGDAALTVDPYNTNELAAAMLRVLTEPNLRSMLIQRGLERASGFTWERTARKTFEIYRRVLESVNQ